MIKSKKILMLSLVPISVIPLTVISCGGPQEVTYFEAENFRISSEGEIQGYANRNHKQFGSLIIKEEYNGVTIKSIRGGAFKNQVGIDNVVLPKTLINIGYGAFQNIKFPVKYDYSFLSKPIEWDLSHLVNLEEIYINAFRVDYPSNIQEQIKFNLNLSGLSKLNIIYSAAFSGRGISSINFDGVNNLETIGRGAFANNQLTSLTIPNSITTIEMSAFERNKLTSINIPDSVTTIGNSAFSDNAFTDINLIKLPAKFNTESELARIGIIIKTPPTPILEEIPIIKEDDLEVKNE